MKKVLSFLTALTFITTAINSVVSCSTIDVRIRQALANWTYTSKTDQPIFGAVFNSDKTINEPYFSYWFIQQILTSSGYINIDKPWNQLLNNNSGIAWPYPSSTNIEEIYSDWFNSTITSIEEGKINIYDLKTLFIYMTIYNPIIILSDTQIFEYKYKRGQSAIEIEYRYKTPTDINTYITTLVKKYLTFLKETVEVKYLKLTKYFLTIDEAKQWIENLVNSLIRILTIMSPTFVIPLSINTNRY
ncbi:hypothetical protein [Spiroplasma endosymbiont of Megaselia nigra]|uniref:hypothetical protein n=1 Tax=Spiroplasma endosymbiont of Megaselia nigra TaxID=2478537 RepID=UPI000F860E52|nr:hypothetical protein [Spiroplasma endosymbiont of Megaselia nigra]RUO86745.1 hypothetical protein D9R21_01285 [Spiroplasma endosymbiont of Megaselia nigra]